MIEFKYMSPSYELKDVEGEEKFMMGVEIEEKENLVSINVPTMCVYFEDEILDMLELYYPNKEAVVRYKSGMELRYYTYRRFIELLDY